jgi:hypothetical protein
MHITHEMQSSLASSPEALRAAALYQEGRKLVSSSPVRAERLLRCCLRALDALKHTALAEAAEAAAARLNKLQARAHFALGNACAKQQKQDVAALQYVHAMRLDRDLYYIASQNLQLCARSVCMGMCLLVYGACMCLLVAMWSMCVCTCGCVVCLYTRVYTCACI